MTAICALILRKRESTSYYIDYRRGWLKLLMGCGQNQRKVLHERKYPAFLTTALEVTASSALNISIMLCTRLLYKRCFYVTSVIMEGQPFWVLRLVSNSNYVFLLIISDDRRHDSDFR